MYEGLLHAPIPRLSLEGGIALYMQPLGLDRVSNSAQTRGLDGVNQTGNVGAGLVHDPGLTTIGFAANKQQGGWDTKSLPG